MNPLNPRLHDHLVRRFGHVRVTNEGEPMQARYLPDWSGKKGKLQMIISSWGETYRVNCPFCSDTKQRLYVNHRWADRDDRTGDYNLHLATCFNEECPRKREQQKQLHAMVYPFGFWAERVEVPVKRPAVQPPRPTSISLPPGTLLDALHPQHPARRYMLRRGFDPDFLASTYRVQFSEPCTSCKPILYEERIVIPLYEMRPPTLTERPCGPARVLQTQRTPGGVRLAGWQARTLRSQPPEDCPKYLTATGTQKSRLLYGLPLAIKTTGPVVLVEGITDAWSIGLSAVSMLGKSLSSVQCSLVIQHFAGRPIVVWLDDDAEEDAIKTRDKIRVARAAAGDLSPVVMARTPADCHDPGECSTEQTAAAIEEALGMSV